MAPEPMTHEPTLGELVSAAPTVALVLERHNLDYCCGGRQTLLAACAGAGIDPAMVWAEIDALDRGPEPEWAEMEPAELIDHIEATHHAYLHREMATLAALAARVLDVHGERHPELSALCRVYGELRADLEPHLAKEERVLFPMIRQLAASSDLPVFHCGSLANPIRVMLAEHDRAGELLAQLRELTDDYEPPADACTSYRSLYAALAELDADLRLHIHKENNVLFPAVLDLEQGATTR